MPGKATKDNIQSSSPAKSLSIVFRTVQADGLLIYTATNNDFTSLEVHMLLSSLWFNVCGMHSYKIQI